MSLADANFLNEYFRKNFHEEATFSVASSGLKPEELNQNDFELYQSYPSSKRKADFLLGRKALYSLLENPALSDFCGKTHPRYSLSHSKGFAVAYDSKNFKSLGVGVDLEFWRDGLVKSRHLYSSKEEWALCKGELDYLRLWTAKESVYKAFGCKDLRLLDIVAKDSKMSVFQVRGKTISCCVFQGDNYAISAALLL